jgi:Arc/MetJ-type ribon-helix-helix transcriptional regulator
MAQIEVPLTDEQIAALEELAKRRHTSLSELIQQGVTNLIRSAASGDKEKRRRAIAVAGLFRSGRGDLSERHDEYFAEASEE